MKRPLFFTDRDWRQTLQTVASNWLIILMGLLINNALNAVTLILVARATVPESYGQYVAVYTTLSFLVMIPSFGTDLWLLSQHRPSKAALEELWQETLGLRIQLLLVWAGMMGLLALALPQSTYPLALMLPTIIGLGFESSSLLGYATLRLREKHQQVTLLQSGGAVLLFGLVLLLPVTANYLALFAIGRMIISMGTFAFVWRLLRPRKMWNRLTSQFANRTILTDARPFFFSELAASVYAKADVVLIAFFLGSGAAGIYGPALNLLQAGALSPRALFFFIMPILSRTYKSARHQFRQRALLQLLAQLLSGGLISLALLLFAPQLIRFLFGNRYDESIRVVLIFSPIPLIRALNFGLAAILIAGNWQGKRTKVQFYSAGFNVLANIIVIGPFGVIGAAVVYVLSELLLLVGYAMLTVRLFQEQAGEEMNEEPVDDDRR